MRNLFLLIALAFCVYFGSSLWTFGEPESFRVVANYIPLAVMVLTLVFGLIHLRFALALTLIFVLISGNSAIYDQVLYRLCNFFGWENFFSEALPVSSTMKFFQLAPVSYECLVLGLFAAWALTRFFGNPELDFEVNRARTARQMHLPVFLFGLTAVLAGIYAVISASNVFMPGFVSKLEELTVAIPAPFFSPRKAAALAALRQATLAIELIAFYTVVVNEVWSERHIKFFVGLLTLIGLFSVCVGIFQRITLTGFSSYIFRYTREVHATFSDPNAWSVFLLTLLPVGLGLLYAGFIPALCGVVTILLLLLGIALSASKVALFWAVLALIIFFFYSLIKAFQGGKLIPPIFMGLLLALAAVFAVGSYISVDQKFLLAYRNDHPSSGVQKDTEVAGKGLFNNNLSIAVANQIDSFRQALTRKSAGTDKLTGMQEGKALQRTAGENEPKGFAENLFVRTNHKSADWHTVFTFLKPSNGHWDVFATGCGIGNFRKLYHEYQPKYLKEVRNQAGSFLLQALVEQGIFGLLALVIISFLTIIVAFGCVEHTASPRTSRVLAFMFTFLVVGCLFENAFLQYQVATVYWLLVGLVMVNAATTNRDFQMNFKLLYVFLILLAIIATLLAIWPKLVTQHFEKKSLESAIERVASRYQEVPENLRSELFANREFNFHRNRIGRWSDKDSVIIVRPEKDRYVLKLEAACGHPKVAPNNPLIVDVAIEGEPAMQFTFTNSTLKVEEIDLRSLDVVRPFLAENDFIALNIHNNITFVPSEHFPSMTNDNYNVGAYIGRITWSDKLAPKPEPKDEEIVEETKEEVITDTEPDVEVEPENPKEVEVPEKTIFGDKVKEEDLNEKLEEMSNFELELPK